MTSHELARALLKLEDRPVQAWDLESIGWEEVTRFRYDEEDKIVRLYTYSDDEEIEEEGEENA